MGPRVIDHTRRRWSHTVEQCSLRPLLRYVFFNLDVPIVQRHCEVIVGVNTTPTSNGIGFLTSRSTLPPVTGCTDPPGSARHYRIEPAVTPVVHTAQPCTLDLGAPTGVSTSPQTEVVDRIQLCHVGSPHSAVIAGSQTNQVNRLPVKTKSVSVLPTDRAVIGVTIRQVSRPSLVNGMFASPKNSDTLNPPTQ